MCGRFAMDGTVYQLLDFLVAEQQLDPKQPGAQPATLAERQPHYNIAPTNEVPVMRERHGDREVADVRWGMVAPGSPTFGGGKPVFNARIESVDRLGLFKNPFLKSRCIVFATGYYEWEQQESGKQPYFIREPQHPLAMAGIVCAWPDPSLAEKDPRRWRLSMSIITRDARVAPGLEPRPDAGGPVGRLLRRVAGRRPRREGAAGDARERLGRHRGPIGLLPGVHIGEPRRAPGGRAERRP
ncbi:SOS response-associated peptidase [Cryobacterium sp. TMT4-10]|uniref:SOS response-associated peptidase n=1 Tax=Cryobacterium sp. TMT4-10 TaxID=1259256 RepID=UPI00106AD3A7|nr:SOS response-associated peptidase family protein [Cryobacterium sp. TMT4-10]TFD17241.1 SOS response-associated peptidase [Cryobacterium sp. TMT4-10]